MVKPNALAAIPAPGEIAARLARLDSFVLCAREAAKASCTNESHAIADVLLYVQNALYDVRCALDPGLSGDDGAASAECAA